jgi:UDP-N-acetylglucosamine 4,6-dehydratase
LFKDKVLFISGSTGSFGTAFCKYLIENGDIPKKLIVFSRDWLKQKKLREELGDPEFMRWRLGDIRDKNRVRQAIKDADIVIHAAAMKDLPSAELNPDETFTINIDGTRVIRDCCIEAGIEKSLLISTDKACLPINTYGISKAAAERIFLDGSIYSNQTKFSVCRYGNVIGSSGSVVQVYRDMVASGAGSLPLTDDGITRFWFPMRDAILFVLDSLSKMQGGELFTPRIKSIYMRDLCSAFGKPYHIIGLRNGEKMHESLKEGYDSGSNSEFLTVNEIKESIKEYI